MYEIYPSSLLCKISRYFKYDSSSSIFVNAFRSARSLKTAFTLFVFTIVCFTFLSLSSLHRETTVFFFFHEVFVRNFLPWYYSFACADSSHERIASGLSLPLFLFVLPTNWIRPRFRHLWLLFLELL